MSMVSITWSYGDDSHIEFVNEFHDSHLKSLDPEDSDLVLAKAKLLTFAPQSPQH